MMTSKVISITKGLGILLMVMAHAGCPKIAQDFIYMFHMPLFFMMSGYCFKTQYINAPKEFARKRVKGLYVPYVKYGLLFLLFHNVFFHINIYNFEFGYKGVSSFLYSPFDFIRHGVCIVTAMKGCEQLLGGYWFIKSLFWGSLISLATIKYVPKVAWGGVLLLTIVTNAFPILHVPYFMIGSREFMASFFFITGFAIKQKQFEMRGGYAVLLCAIVVIGSQLMLTTMLSYKTWQIVPYCAFAIMGTLMVCIVSNKIAEHDGKAKNVMVYIGNHTLTILTWHFLSFKFVSLLIIYIHHLPIEQLAEFPVIADYAPSYWPIYLIVGTIVPLFIDKVENICTGSCSRLSPKS